jgi:hypothetical protein
MGPSARQKTKKATLRPFPSSLPRCDDFVVAVLTGGRPTLLSQTLVSFEKQMRRRMASCTGVVLVNGGDSGSRKVLENHPWLRVENRPGEMRKIGPAVSELMEIVVSLGKRYILHLEDDWACRMPAPQWLDQAAHALEDGRVGQVRMRLEQEKVMRVSMATGTRIRWQIGRDHHRSPNAHLTFNPNLMRTEDVRRVYPCEDEPDAQLRFGRLALDVVQLVPGAFAHIGDTMSLRGGEH